VLRHLSYYGISSDREAGSLLPYRGHGMPGRLVAIALVVAVGEPLKTPDDNPPIGHQFQALVEEYEQGRRDFVAAIRKASTEAEAEKVIAEKRPDEAKHIAKFLEIARKEPTNPIAAKAATWILTHTPSDPDPRAVEIIALHHIKSAAIGPICQDIGFSTARANGEVLRRIARENPHRDIRGKAYLGLAQHLIFNCNRPLAVDRTADLPRAISMQAEAETLLRQVVSDYENVSVGRMTVADAAKMMLSDIGRFGVGKLATEVEGRDAEGRAFKLSDYRGKVVVLTFSGNWCGPCKGMYPDERELVKRLESRAFALLSVSTDEKVDTLRRSLETGEITWRCWWDGGMNGPICKAWDVRQYPTVYVLDPKGVIRYKDVRSDDLKRSVELLMSEQITK
jgi:peroxiredoxin